MIYYDEKKVPRWKKCIYFWYDKGTDCIKIGKSGDLKARMNSVRTHNPTYKFICCFLNEDSDEIEELIKKEYKEEMIITTINGNKHEFFKIENTEAIKIAEKFEHFGKKDKKKKTRMSVNIKKYSSCSKAYHEFMFGDIKKMYKDNLFIKYKHQRSVVGDAVHKILDYIDKTDNPYFPSITLAKEKDKYEVLDGQHRLKAIKLSHGKDDTTVLLYVIEKHEEETTRKYKKRKLETYRSINKNRKVPNIYLEEEDVKTMKINILGKLYKWVHGKEAFEKIEESGKENKTDSYKKVFTKSNNISVNVLPHISLFDWLLSTDDFDEDDLYSDNGNGDKKILDYNPLEFLMRKELINDISEKDIFKFIKNLNKQLVNIVKDNNFTFKNYKKLAGLSSKATMKNMEKFIKKLEEKDGKKMCLGIINTTHKDIINIYDGTEESIKRYIGMLDYEDDEDELDDEDDEDD